MRKSTDADTVLKKLRSKKGESIAEVLVSLLISVLALTMLAGMITASKNALERSKNKMDAYNTAMENVVNQSTAAGTPGKVTMEVENTPWNIAGNTSDVSVNYFVNNTFVNIPVTSYATPTPGP